MFTLQLVGFPTSINNSIEPITSVKYNTRKTLLSVFYCIQESLLHCPLLRIVITFVNFVKNFGYLT